jgi:hypothetical protein
MLIDEEACAQSAASLVLRLELEDIRWSATGIRNAPFESRKSVSHAQLLEGLRWRAQVVRNRNARPELLKMNDCPLQIELDLKTVKGARSQALFKHPSPLLKLR